MWFDRFSGQCTKTTRSCGRTAHLIINNVHWICNHQRSLKDTLQASSFKLESDYGRLHWISLDQYNLISLSRRRVRVRVRILTCLLFALHDADGAYFGKSYVNRAPRGSLGGHILVTSVSCLHASDSMIIQVQPILDYFLCSVTQIPRLNSSDLLVLHMTLALGAKLSTGACLK